jgi:two-component system response regulator AtoC
MVLAEATDELPALLSGAGVDVRAVASLDEAVDLVNRTAPDAVVIDADAHDAPSLERVVRRFAPVAVLAASRGGTQQAVKAIRAGARDFLPIPFERADLDHITDALFTTPDDDVRDSDDAAKLLGKSPKMQRVQELIRQIAPTEATVLVQGETGTGKELVARALHQASARRDGPFVKVHCAGLPETLLESELFGYEKGAFTGAGSRKAGRVEIAEEGTLFLDEIGDISPTMQVKLLRLLQDRQYERLGSNTPLAANVRFIAATHRPLDEMVKSGAFREDLYYRLKVMEIWVPHLRSRRMDVPELAQRFCATFSRNYGKPAVAFSAEALDTLARERWPGNVRQLQNFVERLVVLIRSTVIDAEYVARELAPQNEFATDSRSGRSSTAPSLSLLSRTGPPLPLDQVLLAAERKEIERALRFTNGNKILAARLLKIGRATLFRKIAALGIEYRPSDDDGG